MARILAILDLEPPLICLATEYGAVTRISTPMGHSVTRHTALRLDLAAQGDDMSASSDLQRATLVRMTELADVWADVANKALANIGSRGVSDQERQQLVEIRRVIEWLTEDSQFIDRDRVLA